MTDGKKEVNYNDYIITSKNIKIRIISYKIHNTTYHLATNILDNKYDIVYFNNAYKERWNIEIYFKQLKKCSNIENIKTKNNDKINKEIICINIVSFIYNYILQLYHKYTQNLNKINNSQFIKNFYKYLLPKIIYGTLKLNFFIKNITVSIIIIINTTILISVERYSIMPYTKWHYKHVFIKNTKNKM